MAEHRVPITIRMSQAEKDLLALHTDACGLDTSVGARQVLTLCTAFLAQGDGVRWSEMIHRIDQALKETP